MVILHISVFGVTGITSSHCLLLRQPINNTLVVAAAAAAAILHRPCNQFGAQESGSPAQIKSFVSDKYGVEFAMMVGLFNSCWLTHHRCIGSRV